MKHRITFLLGSMCLLLSPLARAKGSGTWSSFAHDASRTARADGTGAMKAPVAAWSRFMGGALAKDQSVLFDANGDGKPDIATISGGRISVARPDGSLVWKSANLGSPSLQGAWDLDGSGSVELIVASGPSTQVLEGATGKVLANLSMTRPTRASFVPAGKGGFLVLAMTGGDVSAFDFRAGTNVTAAAWTIQGMNPVEFLTGDLDGDASPEMVMPLSLGFQLVDPLSGKVEQALPDMSPWAYFYSYQLADVDGNPGQEIVAVDVSYQYSPYSGIYVLGVRSGKLEVIWKSVDDDPVALASDYFTVAGSAASLDADSSVEIVYSQWDGSAWSTHVVDGATGEKLATLEGQFLQAVVDIDADGKKEIVTRNGVGADQRPPRSTLRAYDFDSRAAGLVVKNWSVPNARAVFVDSSQRRGPWALTNVPVTASFDGSGAQLLIAQDDQSRKEDTRLLTLRGDGTWSSSQVIPPDIRYEVLGWGDGLTAPASLSDLALYSSDGYVSVTDRTFAQLAKFEAGSFADWTYVASLGDKNAIFSASSNGALRWIDGTHLDKTGIPHDLYAAPRTVPSMSQVYPADPVKVLEGKSAPVLVTVEQQEAHQTLVGHDSTGVEVWRTSLAPGSWIREPGSYVHDFTGDGTEDLLLPLVNVNALLSLAIYNGATGKLVRSTPLDAISPGSDGLAVGSLVDVSGDQQPDLVVPINNKGPMAIDVWQDPMVALWSTPTLPASAMVNGTMGVAPLVTAGAPEVFRVGGNNGFGPYGRLDKAGKVVATHDTGVLALADFDRNAAALVSRGGGAFDLVVAGSAYEALSRVQRLDGATFAAAWTVFVAGGNVGTAPPADGVALRDPVELDVDGDGAEDVVVGADDGWIYALRAVDGTKVFTVDLGSPVVHVIAANIDLDPALELVASTADGRLHALDEPGLYKAKRDPDGAPGGGGSGGNGGSSGSGGLPGAGSGGGGGNGDGGGGCGCRAAPADAGFPIAVAALLLGAASVRRSRRSQR